VTSPLSDDPPQREDETPREDHAFLGCRAYDWCRICHYDSDGCGLMPSDPVHVPALLAERDSLSKRLERMEKALREIEAIRCGVLGHSVAVDCQASGIAHRALSPQAAE
jgi:hypothetical protein